MKSLNQYINEKLKVSKNQNQYNYCPKTREELDDLLDQLLKERGWEADLNDINVSNIINMGELFLRTPFNGNISNWDVSNVTTMEYMFGGCFNFEGKGLENWDVSNVVDMSGMFIHCNSLDYSLNCNLSKWDVSSLENTDSMFYGCTEFKGKGLENWDVSNVTNMECMFYDCKKLDCNLSKWDVSNVTNYYDIFDKCPIKDEYKPKFR